MEMKCCALIVAAMVAGGARAHAAFTEDFNYPSGTALPAYYNTGGSKLTNSALALTGTSLKLTANTAGGSGFTQGCVPSLAIATTGAAATWKVSAVLSADWYGANELTGSYASAGLAIFSGGGNAGSGVQLQIKHEASTDKDYLEIAWGGTTFRSGWSAGLAATASTPYTIWIEKLANGDIQYGIGSTVLDKIKSDTTATGAKEAYTLLSTLGTADLSLGMYINGQSYSAAGSNPAGLKVSATFDQLTVDGLTVAVPEAATAGVLGIGVAGLLVKRK